MLTIKLQGGEVRKERALWSVVLLAESAAFVAYEASRAVSALERRDAATKASPSKYNLRVYVQRRVQPVHRGRYLRATTEEVRPTAGRKRSGRWRLPWRLHLGVYLQRRDPRRYV